MAQWLLSQPATEWEWAGQNSELLSVLIIVGFCRSQLAPTQSYAIYGLKWKDWVHTVDLLVLTQSTSRIEPLSFADKGGGIGEMGGAQ